MWFDDDIAGRRLLFKRKRNRRRTPVLQVRARVSTKKKVHSYRTAVFVLVPTVLAIAAALLFFGMRAAVRLLFSENSMFTIRLVDVRAESDVVRELTREYTQIAEGMNIFGFDMAGVRASVLRRTPGFKSLRISRLLPDTVRIEVVERVPLAQLGRRSHLVADREGHVFVKGSEADQLPALIGYPYADIAPGDRVMGMAAAALQVLDACRDPRLDLDIRSIRVDGGEELVLELSHEGREKEVALSWEGMGQDTSDARRRLIRKVVWIREAIESVEGRGRRRFDATFDGEIYAK
jgi:cell division septal protein FtsQ